MEVHVWQVTLDLAQDEVERLKRWLSTDELGRAERLIFADHRKRFIAARGSLRAILGRYLNIAPADICFEYALHGKPQLAAIHVLPQPLYFNLAHSEEIALIAVTGIGAVGIDVERIRPAYPSEQVARNFFSPGEIGRLGKLPAHEYDHAFFHCWTRKEAFIKATGQGLLLPLDQFEVSLPHEESATLLRTDWNPDEAANWSLHQLEAGAGYAASLAVRGHDFQLKCWTLAL